MRKSLLGLLAGLVALLASPEARAEQRVVCDPSYLSVTTRGGAAPFFNDAVAGTVVQVKATAAQLYSLRLVNTTAAVAYLQVWWKPSASVNIGTTAPEWVVRLAANETAVIPIPAMGIAKSPDTGLSIAGCTTSSGACTGAAISVSATTN